MWATNEFQNRSARTVARVSLEEHMANYRAARALMDRAVTRVKERPGFQIAGELKR